MKSKRHIVDCEMKQLLDGQELQDLLFDLISSYE